MSRPDDTTARPFPVPAGIPTRLRCAHCRRTSPALLPPDEPVNWNATDQVVVALCPACARQGRS